MKIKRHAVSNAFDTSPPLSGIRLQLLGLGSLQFIVAFFSGLLPMAKWEPNQWGSYLLVFPFPEELPSDRLA